MHDNVNVIRLYIVQPHRFNQLQALVHHACGVDGDFGAHAPVRMMQRLLLGDVAHLLAAHAEERAAGCCQQNAVDAVARCALQALENCRVLGIHRQNRHALFTRCPHDDLSGAHQRFLIGKRNRLSRFNGSHRRQQSHHADNRRHNDIRFRQGRGFNQAVHAGNHANIRVCRLGFQLFCLFFIVHRNQRRMQGTRLLLCALDIGIDRNRAHLRLDGIENINGLCADRAGRTENNNIFHVL